MKILVLGGTGAMGISLVELLKKSGYHVFVTSRSFRKNEDGITYLRGNAKDLNFISNILQNSVYDAIVDFMSYNTNEFKERYELLLQATEQYIFISSARIFAECKSRITETTPRLLDTINDEEYLKTDEYALTKARQEDFLMNSGMYNWTIIRPSITYSSHRLQLGVLEKEQWLYRALHGRNIVFSYDIADKYTTMTTGQDVAKCIFSVVGKQHALGKSFNIASEKSYKWEYILNCYLDILQEHLGYRPQVAMSAKTIKWKDKIYKYQIIYSRYFNRFFDCTAIKSFCDLDFQSPDEGLKEALRSFLRNPEFKAIDWRFEAWSDRISGERTPLAEIPSLREKFFYMCYRNRLDFIPTYWKKMRCVPRYIKHKLISNF